MVVRHISGSSRGVIAALLGPAASEVSPFDTAAESWLGVAVASTAIAERVGSKQDLSSPRCRKSGPCPRSAHAWVDLRRLR